MLILAYSPQMVILTVLCVAIFPACLLTRYLLKRGSIDLAAWFFVIWFLLVLLMNTQLIEGLNPLLVPGFFLRHNCRQSLPALPHPYIVAALAASGLYLLRAVATHQGFAAAEMDPGTGEVFLSSITVLAFIFVTFLNQLITGDLRRALDDATHDLQERRIASSLRRAT